MKENLISAIQAFISNFGGNINVAKDDIEDLQIYDGDGDGESHGIVLIISDGCEMDDGDFYDFADLDVSELELIIDYIKDIWESL